MKIHAIAAALAYVLVLLCAPAQAQVSGPVAPPPKYEVKRVPAQPADVKPPPIPADEIIRRFTTNEDAMKKAFDQFSFSQTIRIKEMSDPAGEFIVVGEMYVKSDGERYDRIVKQPVSTLKQTSFTLEDVKTIANLPLFALTTDQLPKYTLTYEGTEKLDQLDTFIFRVKPKQLLRNQPLFDGVVWVDQQEFAIVKSSGKYEREVVGQGTGLPFSMFDTYRENIQGKYWFPTYIASEDYISQPNGQNLPLHLVVRSANFQPNPIEVTSPPPPAAAPPASKPN